MLLMRSLQRHMVGSTAMRANNSGGHDRPRLCNTAPQEELMSEISMQEVGSDELLAIEGGGWISDLFHAIGHAITEAANYQAQANASAGVDGNCALQFQD